MTDELPVDLVEHDDRAVRSDVERRRPDPRLLAAAVEPERMLALAPREVCRRPNPELAIPRKGSASRSTVVQRLERPDVLRRRGRRLGKTRALTAAVLDLGVVVEPATRLRRGHRRRRAARPARARADARRTRLGPPGRTNTEPFGEQLAARLVAEAPADHVVASARPARPRARAAPACAGSRRRSRPHRRTLGAARPDDVHGEERRPHQRSQDEARERPTPCSLHPCLLCCLY